MIEALTEAKESKVIPSLSSKACSAGLMVELAKPNPSQEIITDFISRCSGPDLYLSNRLLPEVLDTEKRHAAIKMIVQGLEGNTAIKGLYADSLNLDDNNVTVIANLLGYTDKRATKITTLGLAKNEIGDAGAKALAKMLSANTTLHTLFLDSNPITEKGIKNIADVLLSLENTTLIHGYFRSFGSGKAENSGYAGKIHQHFDYLIGEKYKQAAEKAKLIEESLRVTNLPSDLSNLVFGYTGLDRFKKFKKKEEPIPAQNRNGVIKNDHHLEASEYLLELRSMEKSCPLSMVFILLILIVPFSAVVANLVGTNASGVDEIAQHLTSGTGGSIVPNWVTWTVSIAIPIILILLREYLRYKARFQLSDAELYEIPHVQGEDESEVPSNEIKSVI
jgi:Leucine Rich repeat